MMSCSASGAPTPRRSRRVHDELGGHHLQTVASVGVAIVHGDADDGIVGAVEGEIGHLRFVAEVDARFVVEPAAHTPFEQRPSRADDLDVTSAGLLPGAAQPDTVLRGHVDLERSLAHHVVDDAREDALQLDLPGGQQVVQVPTLCRARPALAATVRAVLLQHDDAIEGLAEHFRRRDARDAAADDHRGAAAAAAHLGNVHARVIQPSRGAAARRPAGHELLVVQPDTVKAIVVQPGSGCVDHGDRTAQIHVGVTARQHPLVEQVGDQPGAPIPVGVRASDDDVHLQAANAAAQLGEFVELAQVFGALDPVEQVDRVSDIGIQALGHRQDR